MTALEPHIAVRAVQPVVAGLEALGHEVDAILEEAGIVRRVLDDADGRIPHRAMMELWSAATARSGDDALGVHVAEAAPVRSFGVHAYALLASPTLREAYRRGCRYQRLIHEATHLDFEEGDEVGVLRHSLPDGRAVPRQPAEFLASVWVRLGRLVSESDWAPEVVCFAHPRPGDDSELARMFGSPIRFGSGSTAVHVTNAVLDLENRRGDDGLAAVLDDYATSLLAIVPARPSVTERVRACLIRRLLGGEAPTADQVADELHTSVRSVHRGLEADGTTFRALSDRVRHERGAELLADPRYSIAEVGYLLGFAESSSFYRAFKRWTGETPGEFRAKAMRGRD